MLQNVPYQIVQSPARLGLPNPNSPSLQTPPTPPKFSSQISQSHHSHQQSNLSTTTTSTSSTLLPLLPPLSRAQSLLIQMASLASRLFEVSPNRPHWLNAFRGSLPSFLSSQTQSLTPIPLDSHPSSLKEIIPLFTTLQTQLFEAVAELQEILDLQDAKQKITREIRSKDSAILAFANKLREAEHVLDVLVDDYADYRRLKRSKLEDDAESSTTTVATQIKLSDIISYAHRISYTTFAPPEFGAGQAPLRGALPPAPQEEQLRASQLYSFADLDVGIPKTVEDKETAIEPFIDVPATQPMESNPLGNLAATQDSGYIRFEEAEAAQKAHDAVVLAEEGGLIVKNYVATLDPVTGCISILGYFWLSIGFDSEESGLVVDVEGFNKAMDEARERSRNAQNKKKKLRSRQRKLKAYMTSLLYRSSFLIRRRVQSYHLLFLNLS